MIDERGLLGAEDDIVYLFLPLAHAFALLIQLGAFDIGTTIAYFGGDTKQIIPELMQVHPTYLPSVPRIFEKLYTLAQRQIPAPSQIAAISDARRQGPRPRAPRPAGPAGAARPLDAPIEARRAGRSFAQRPRQCFGGNLRQAVTGAAPIAKEILEFFYGAACPVLEGYGMTETATVATTRRPTHHKFGTVGRAAAGRRGEDRRRRRDPASRARTSSSGYYKNDDASFGAIVDGWLHTGDLGTVDEDGYVSITGRKKDIIITAGGKNLTPGQPRERPQADPLGLPGGHARRPPARTR